MGFAFFAKIRIFPGLIGPYQLKENTNQGDLPVVQVLYFNYFFLI